MKVFISILTLALWFFGARLLVLTFSQPRCEGETFEQKRIGLWKCYDAQARLLSRMNYENGRKNGRMELFYAEGGYDTISHWVNGKMEGDFESYARGGQLLLKATYQNDRFEGYLSEWNSDGELVYQCLYHLGKPQDDCPLRD